MEPKVRARRKFVFQQKLIQLAPVLGVAALILITIHLRRLGVFASPQDLQAFIKQFGSFAVVVFILVQGIQPIIPFIPGGIATVVGMLMFGNIPGILYSYIGLIIGEFGLFLLSRRYGPRFAQLILSGKNYQTFEKALHRHTKKIRRLLIVCFIFPFLPDDIICLVAGMTDLSFKEYAKIVLIFKLWSVASYGYLIVFVLDKTILF